MGNYPSEYNGAHCSVCNKYLPPCKSFDGFTKKTIDRKVDVVNVYVFLGGKYYRLVGGSYFCPDCFWSPKNDYIRKQEEQRRRREEQRRKEQQERQERQRREEEERRRERERQEELKRREQEAKEESARQEALRQERMKKEEERKKEQLEFERQESNKKSLSDRFLSWSLNKDKEKFQHQVRAESYKNPQTTGAEDSKDVPKIKVSDDDEYELWSDDLINDDDPDPEPNEVINETMITSEVVSLVSKLHPSDDYIDVPWLKVVQTQLLNHYATINGLSAMEVEVLMYYLSCIRYGLNDVNHLYLTKMMCSLSHSNPLEYEHTQTTLDDDLPGRFMISLLESGYELNHCNTECMQQCLNLLVSNCTKDAQLQTMIAAKPLPNFGLSMINSCF